MLPRNLLRFPDLKRVGINNWPTLKRRIQQDHFPPGRYVGKNTRVWTEEEVGEWWDSLPRAGAPPDIIKPAAASLAGEAGNGREPKSPLFTPGYSQAPDSPQPPRKTGVRDGGSSG